MNGQLKYEIELKGTEKIQTVNNEFSSLLSPLDKITKILTNISNRILQLTNNSEKSCSALTQITAAVNRTTDAFIKQKKQADAVKDSVDEIKKEVETPAKTSFFDSLGKAGFNLTGLKTLASSAVDAFAPIFQEGMARETAAVNFGTLLGDKDAGKKYADALRNTDAATLYGTDTVNEAAKSMLSFGIDSNTAMTTIKQLGDIAGGDAQKLGSLSLAFAQISAAGKLSGQDLMQLINAGFNPLEEMSKKTGKSIGQLKNEMAKGAISSQDVADAIASATGEGGKFNGMLKNVMDNTLQGKMAAMQSKFDDIKAKLFEIALPIADKLIPVISQLADTLIPLAENVIAPLFTFIADNFDTMLVLVEIILAIVGAVKIWTGAQWLLNVAMNANPIGLVITAVAALIGLVYIITNAYNKWGAAVTFLLGPLGMIINLVMTIKRYWNDIVQAFQGDGIIAGLKRIGVMLLDLLLYPVQQLLELLSHIPGLGDLANTGAMVIKGLRMKMGAINPETEQKEDTTETATPNDTMDTLTAAVNGGGTPGGSDLSKTAQKSTEAVATGGTRNTQITINLDNMVETVNFNGSVEDNSAQTVDTFTELLLRALYSVQTAV